MSDLITFGLGTSCSTQSGLIGFSSDSHDITFYVNVHTASMLAVESSTQSFIGESSSEGAFGQSSSSYEFSRSTHNYTFSVNVSHSEFVGTHCMYSEFLECGNAIIYGDSDIIDGGGA